MDPIVAVLRFGGVERPVGSYGLMLVVALAVGAALSLRAASRARIDLGTTIAALGIVVGTGALGAWGLFAIVEWVTTGTPMGAIGRPGLVFLGAPLGGAVGLWGAGRWLGLPVRRFADVAVVALPAAHAMGRIGCFLGGCCFGRPWDGALAVTAAHGVAPAAHPPLARHPVALYESAGLIALALAFSLLPPSRVGDGRRLLAYLGSYGALRILIEGFRGDAVRGIFLDGRLSTSQVLGGLLLLGALGGLLLLRARPARDGGGGETALPGVGGLR